MLIHTCHDVPMPCCAVATRSCFQSGMVGAWHGMCEANTVALCKSNDKDIISFLSNTAWYLYFRTVHVAIFILFKPTHALFLKHIHI